MNTSIVSSSKKLINLLSLCIIFHFCLMFVSCANIEDNRSGNDFSTVKALDDYNIRKLKAGMEINEVIKICGRLPLSKLPIYRYPAKDGGVYFFYYIPTNEFELAKSDEMRLVAITKIDSENWPSTPDEYIISEDPHSKAYYIIPSHLRGKAFTGLKIPVEK